MTTSEIRVEKGSQFKPTAVSYRQPMKTIWEWVSPSAFIIVGDNACKSVLDALKFALVEIRQTSEKGFAVVQTITNMSIHSKGTIRYCMPEITKLNKRVLTNDGHVICHREFCIKQDT